MNDSYTVWGNRKEPYLAEVTEKEAKQYVVDNTDSDMLDLFIQNNFFSGPAQAALVMDPLSGAVAMCRCFEYVTMIVNPKMTAICASRKNVSMPWLYAPSPSSLATT